MLTAVIKTTKNLKYKKNCIKLHIKTIFFQKIEEHLGFIDSLSHLSTLSHQRHKLIVYNAKLFQ